MIEFYHKRGAFMNIFVYPFECNEILKRKRRSEDSLLSKAICLKSALQS